HPRGLFFWRLRGTLHLHLAERSNPTPALRSDRTLLFRTDVSGRLQIRDLSGACASPVRRAFGCVDFLGLEGARLPAAAAGGDGGRIPRAANRWRAVLGRRR